jgi:dephospho-CoA kinase
MRIAFGSDRWMKTIGITGGIASGKSTVAQILIDLGFEVLSADRIAREVVAPGLPAYHKVIAGFGPEVRLADGQLDRKKLGELVFADQGLRRQLERIIHPEVFVRMRTEIAARQAGGQPFFFMEVPLLFETGLEKIFDLIWVVNLTTANQLQRVSGRDQLDEAAARERIAAQLSLAEKAARADWVIENNGSLSDLREQVRRAVRELKKTDVR